MAQLTDALLAEGFGHEEIGRVMGGNVLRLLEANLPGLSAAPRPSSRHPRRLC